MTSNRVYANAMTDHVHGCPITPVCQFSLLQLKSFSVSARQCWCYFLETTHTQGKNIGGILAWGRQFDGTCNCKPRHGTAVACQAIDFLPSKARATTRHFQEPTARLTSSVPFQELREQRSVSKDSRVRGETPGLNHFEDDLGPLAARTEPDVEPPLTPRRDCGIIIQSPFVWPLPDSASRIEPFCKSARDLNNRVSISRPQTHAYRRRHKSSRTSPKQPQL